MAGISTRSEVTIRRATDADVPAILELARRSLGWLGDEQDTRFFRWKHFESPFGPSPMWVAEADGRIAGFRTFLRWELVTPARAVHRVVRAVDTATDPDFRGRGIFTMLTLHAIDELRAEGVDFVFNTPNDQSRPGYLKMGWAVVGHLPVAVRPTGLGSFATLARARVPASRGAVAVNVGIAAPDAFADLGASTALATTAPRAPGLATHRSAAYFAWRYGLTALHYRVVAAPAGIRGGFAVFRLRRRGRALEAVVADIVTPEASTARALLGWIAREAGADHMIRLDRPPVTRAGFVRVPRVGPVLTARAIGTDPPLHIRSWALTMGDIELF